MPRKKQEYKRISVYSPLPDYENIEEGAKELNMPISGYCLVLIKLGLQVVKVSRDPTMFEYFRKLEQEQE